eukprot:TRINITY_DN15734_c0_g1_i1.p1 TRINITY_DN15734_c0_g1~~TRINITY_DN15734_c0_g1_i1.p1  ORF type:complete len:770 (+),score=130.16 TRINITY_DN15734_c0_g1_i1:43-2310(+)
MADFHDIEDRDGVRFSFNVWPSSRVEAAKIVVPIGCLYSPFRKIEGMPVLPYEPIVCRGCRAILNPNCSIDFVSKIWICPFCFQRNHFPTHYHEISESQLPAELIPTYSTIEYQLPRPAGAPPVFVYLVDTCLDEAELVALREALTLSLSWLPEHALVGLVTFGTTVQVHEIGYGECSKAVVFRGTRDITPDQMRELLGLGQRRGAQQRGPAPQQQQARPGASRFLLPASECEFVLQTILDELTVDPWPVSSDSRPGRCTGAATAAAVALAEAAGNGAPARVLLFVGGPCVAGPGQVATPPLRETMRSHNDMEQGRAPLVKEALKHYKTLAQRCVQANVSVDIYACCLDQVGLFELRDVEERTGGVIVMAETFSSGLFRQAFQKRFRREQGVLDCAFGASIEIATSREFKISGALGPCESLHKTSPSVSEQEIGQGHTCAWKMCGADATTTLAVYFDVASQPTAPTTTGEQRYLQFVTHYQHPSGTYRVRVTTLARSWVDGSVGTAAIGAGFDQEAAAVLVARLASHRAQSEPSMDVVRWIDRTLIRLAAKFGDYRKDDPSSFQLSPQFSLFPQFMFHLRRSPLINVFNASPDETAFYRHLLIRENVSNSLLMVQPTLLQYSFSGPAQPVLLDVKSIQPESILLLDTFTHIVIFHGATIAHWRRENFHKLPQYESFRQLLQASQDDAKAIMADRFPIPRFIDCDEHGSQARFLLAKLNPSVTHNTPVAAQGAYIVTDDVSLEVFLEHLARLAVAS